MKKGRILLGVGFLIVSISVYAQDYAFKVLANKGANEYKSGDGWQTLKTGASLKSGDELKLSENSYLGLVHVTGKPLELKTAGNYKVADLAAKMSGGASAMNKYTDFILSSNSAEAKKNRLSATGAVHRGEPTLLSVYLPPPQNANIFGSSMIVKWETPKSGGPYVVTLKNIFEDDLAKFETPETELKIDLSVPKLAAETAFLVEVASKMDAKTKSEGKVVKKLSAADMDKIKKSYSEISGELKEQTALDKFIQAGFYEQNGLLIDALTSYEEAIKMAPDIDSYREARDEFLYRNKLATQKP
ncbi:MAG TPA: hypothetical protein PLR06_07745 [Cyclobacteriaceae bacterium]|nr:hypothetical protein [Cyclobacteriaceae bacterium]